MISVAQSAVVNGPEVTLGEVATVRGDLAFVRACRQLVLGRAPFPGDTRTFSRSQVIMRLKQHQIDYRAVAFSCPREVAVRTRSERYTSKQIAELTRAYIRAHMPWEPNQVTIEDVRGDSLVVPTADVSHRFVVSENENYAGRFRAELLFERAGAVVASTRVSALVRVLTPVVVAAHDMDRHTVISRQDLRVEMRDLARFPRATNTAISALVGRRCQNRIAAGAVLDRDCVEAVPVVCRGDIVTLCFAKGGLRITTQAEVLEDAVAGAPVRVCNLSSRSRLTGIARTSELVEVK